MQFLDEANLTVAGAAAMVAEGDSVDLGDRGCFAGLFGADCERNHNGDCRTIRDMVRDDAYL